MTETSNAPEPETPVADDSGLTQDDRTWGMVAHLSALAGFIIPFGSVLGPLIVWLMKKDESEFVADQGKEALNFQITVALAGIVCLMLMFILIGILLLPALILAAAIFTIIAAIDANKGNRYRYPFALRLIT